jgi:TolB-like protein
MDQVATHVVYEFGDFRLDATRRLLFRRGATRHLPLSPHDVDTLLYLVEHEGELLAKDQLLAALWPGAVVEENSLNRTVSSVRRWLGEAPGENRYIVTVPGRGYRFVAEVARVVLPAVRRSNDATVAVLPFDDLSDGSDGWLARAIAESVLHRLAAIPGLAVVAHTSSFAARWRGAGAILVGQRLGARYLVEGSVQRSGARLRTTVQLVDALTGTQVWSRRFECSADDIFAAEDEIAEPVAVAIEMTLREPRGPHDR